MTICIDEAQINYMEKAFHAAHEGLEHLGDMLEEQNNALDVSDKSREELLTQIKNIDEQMSEMKDAYDEGVYELESLLNEVLMDYVHAAEVEEEFLANFSLEDFNAEIRRALGFWPNDLDRALKEINLSVALGLKD
jgi:DNA repair ATPase RecN